MASRTCVPTYSLERPLPSGICHTSGRIRDSAAYVHADAVRRSGCIYRSWGQGRIPILVPA